MDLSLLPLVFSLILSVTSRLLHPYCTDDKTSRLMVKRFSTVKDTQRGSQSYMEKRRGRREIEVTKRIKGGGSKGERQIQPVISSLSVLHHPEHTGNSQSWVKKRRGREETEATWWRKRRVQRGRGKSSQ